MTAANNPHVFSLLLVTNVLQINNDVYELHSGQVKHRVTVDHHSK